MTHTTLARIAIMGLLALGAVACLPPWPPRDVPPDNSPAPPPPNVGGQRSGEGADGGLAGNPSGTISAR
jgi:hypothetical protein